MTMSEMMAKKNAEIKAKQLVEQNASNDFQEAEDMSILLTKEEAKQVEENYDYLDIDKKVCGGEMFLLPNEVVE